MFLLEDDWKEALSDEFNKEYYKELMKFVEDEYNRCEVFPPKECVFSALNYTALKDVKCVIFGQDPYHNDGQAHGLAFSVNKNIDIPPSLVNIYKELESDVGIDIPNHGYLVSLAKQGVLLLNTVFTVRAHEANSHKNKGWEKFSDAIVDILNKQDRPIVFMLWGKPAQSKMKRLNNENHLILTAPHPSPLSSYRGFFGCKHFSKANEFLASNGIDPINWQV
jgi:uracil-DNA glycosylase